MPIRITARIHAPVSRVMSGNICRNSGNIAVDSVIICRLVVGVGGGFGGCPGRRAGAVAPALFVSVEEVFLPEAEVVAFGADDDVVEQFDADDVG
jgi:hypothetical protein